MTQTKNCKVVMLPTEKNLSGQYINKCSREGMGLTYVHFDFEKDQIRLNKDSENVMTWIKPCCQPQHLYLISTDPKEEIKEGDWYYWSYPEQGKEAIFQCFHRSILGRLAGEIEKKIIASTDPSLGLPLIPLSFIQKYVAAQGAIESVKLLVNNKCIHSECGQVICDCRDDFELELTTPNEVIVLDEPRDLSGKNYADKGMLPDDYVTEEELDEMRDNIAPFEKERYEARLQEDQELEDAAEDRYKTASDEEYKYQLKKAFKAGANWQKERSANDSIEMLNWINQQGWYSSEPAWCNGEHSSDIYNGKSTYTEITSEQLYQLWQESKKKL